MAILVIRGVGHLDQARVALSSNKGMSPGQLCFQAVLVFVKRFELQAIERCGGGEVGVGRWVGGGVGVERSLRIRYWRLCELPEAPCALRDARVVQSPH